MGVESLLEAGLRLYSRVAPTERGGYRLVRFARRFRRADVWRDTFRTPDGLVLDLDLGTYPDCCMAFGLYELDTARLMRRLLRPGDHFVDGGANIGYFTLLAGQWVGPTGRVDAFEPEPRNHLRLVAHLKRNRPAAAVHVHCVALSKEAGEGVIHFYDDASHNHGCASLFAEPGVASQDSVVQTARMDEVLAGTAPRLIKLDVEGAEPLVVAGMSRLLQNDPPPIVIAEYNPRQARIAGFEPRELIDRLLDAQPAYRVYAIGWRLRPIQPTRHGLARMRQGNLLFRA